MSIGGKLLGGVLGWAFAGPLGGLLGFLIGSVFDTDHKIPSGKGGQTYSNGGVTGQRNSFLVSLLVLVTAVIKADGKYLKMELDNVKDFIARSFGSQYVPEAMEILKQLKDKNINVEQVGGQIASNMNYSQRMQLFHYLVSLAKCDGEMVAAEADMLKRISVAIGLKMSDIESIFAMFENNIDAAYKVLEIDPKSSDDEVRKAYKRMAMKHHPDKVASLGQDVQKAAEEKFKQIQDAYEAIKRSRNMN